MLAARQRDSAARTKNREMELVKLQNLASAVTRTNVHMFRMQTAMAHPLSSSTIDRTRVRVTMARYLHVVASVRGWQG